MRREGSITVYLSLTLCVCIALIAGSILSVKIQAGRMAAANSVDQALYSLLARYDRDLYERYGLFFLDTGRDGRPDMAAVCDEISDAMQYILQPNRGRELAGGKNLLTIAVTDRAVTGCTLATDAGGTIFAEQAVAYMKDTLGAQGITLLKERVDAHTETTRKQDREGAPLAAKGAGVSYEDLKQQSETVSEEIGEAAAPQGEEAENYKKILPAVQKLRTGSLLDLTVPDSCSISEKSLSAGSLPSGRDRNSGFGLLTVSGGSGAVDKFLFQEYLMQFYASCLHPEQAGSLSYQLEYIIAGRTSDRNNLEAVVTRLVAIRTAANILALYADSSLHAELAAVSAAIASVMLLPEAEPVIRALLSAGWAFCEALTDVRALLSGKRVAINKNSETWQVHAEEIPLALTEPDSLTKHVRGGMSYEDYLRVLLTLSGTGTKTMRAMDMTEDSIRGGGREAFRLDCCVFSLEVEMQMKLENRKAITVTRAMSYSEL